MRSYIVEWIENDGSPHVSLVEANSKSNVSERVVILWKKCKTITTIRPSR